MPVYVQNKHGHPLMPCTPAKARHLLKSRKAKVIKRTPFTIQLLYLDGKAIHNSANTRNLRLLERSTNYLIERTDGASLTTKVTSARAYLT